MAEVKLEWLKKCVGPAGDMPANSVGNLLQDYADVAAAFAECQSRHSSLADYISEVVKKERAAK